MDEPRLFPNNVIDPPQVYLKVEYCGRGNYTVSGHIWYRATLESADRFYCDRLTLEEAFEVVEAVTTRAYEHRED